MIRKCAAALTAVMLAWVVAAPAPADETEGRINGYGLVRIFNQHLYRGLMSRPRAVAYDRERKEIWVAETDGGVIGVYRPDGMELFSFTGGEAARDPVRIAVRPDGDLAVIAGKRDGVTLFSYRGQYKGRLELERIGEQPVLGALAFDGAGNLWVAENASGQIFVYEPSGRLRLRFGSKGQDEGQFTSVAGIAFGAEGRVYVMDQRAIAVQVFDSQGNFLHGWGKHALGKANFSLPSGIAVDSREHVIVTDELRHSVKIFDRNGELLVNLGGVGAGPGQFLYPSDVAVDENDRLIVTERASSRVQIFKPIFIKN